MTRAQSRPGMPGWAQKLSEEVVGGSPVEIGRWYEHPTDGAIKVVSGQYWGNAGLSNHWRWRLLDGTIKPGYADDWPEIIEMRWECGLCGEQFPRPNVVADPREGVKQLALSPCHQSMHIRRLTPPTGSGDDPDMP